MGVSFSYFTLEDVSNEVRDVIQAEAKSINESRDWTSTEALCFFQMEGYESKVFGDSKFFADGVGSEADGIPDVERIVDALKDWSRRLNISWQIRAEGSEVGVIQAGELDDRVQGFVQSLSDADLWQF